ncbi:hypothetical protein FQN54_008861 [Arachnomyces sp. PD_36]|nr:hypothetical protein FQN54_008861 [Arachnomyces sp. PD_36]
MRLSLGLLSSLLATLALGHNNGGTSHGHGGRQNLNQKAAYAVKEPPLTTPWTYKLGTNPWPEYPRPQLQRSEWQNLNGIWTYQRAQSLQAVNNPPFGAVLPNEVLVPSCLESGLSGIQEANTFYSWFQTSFTVPPNWSEQGVLLHFGAIDYEATVFINGKKAAFHRGGYFHFTVDATDLVNLDGKNELLVFVHDPTDSDGFVIPIGKQALNPSHIFYRPCSGIWQSVWLEQAPTNHITQLDVSAVNVTVHSSTKQQTPVSITVHDNGSDDILATHNASSDGQFQFAVDSPKLWSPDSPNLYNITVRMGNDEVTSYTGFRTISKGVIDGVPRPLVNGEFVFHFGTLDQGYWPDGLHTPPNREAMVYDLQMLKKLGFNMVRKHIKVEPALFYQACDQMGLVVIQDMPSLPANRKPNVDQQKEFNRQLELLINQLKSHPSIWTWVIYNEGWGQVIDGYPEIGLTDLVRKLDPTRLIDSTSGWYDHGAGDFSDNHHYANPQCGSPFYSLNTGPYDPSRIAIQGEFGGVGHNVTIDHLWNVQQAIDGINETYEVDENLEAWNYRSHLLLSELTDQVRKYSCSAGVWTQTTDVEGEVNGLLTYDRRVLRTDEAQWQADIQGLYDAATARSEDPDSGMRMV